ncbi:hypothetical protein TPE18NC_0461a [Treponema pallidum subsp. pertenue]|nr:hypothetical protein TPFB_0461a [Treponema pallidum str. Fribourg-Blanc]WGK72909.1 hypothetical protein TPE18NC_0461a [Treponema pallidum subsp. pertenue]
MDYSSFQSFPLFPPITALMQTWHVPAPITGTETPPEAAIRATGGGVSEVRALPPPVVPFPEERRQMLKRVPLPHFLTRDG